MAKTPLIDKKLAEVWEAFKANPESTVAQCAYWGLKLASDDPKLAQDLERFLRQERAKTARKGRQSKAKSTTGKVGASGRGRRKR